MARQKPRPPSPRKPYVHPAPGSTHSLALRRAALGPVCPRGNWCPPAPLDFHRALGLWINNSKLEQPAGSTARDGLTAIYNGAGSSAGT